VSKKAKNHSESTPDEFEESVQQKTPLGVNVKWRSTASPHDFPAAANYLSLLAEPKLVDEIVARLKKAEVSHYRANDILRAADLALLDMGDGGVPLSGGFSLVHSGRCSDHAEMSSGVLTCPSGWPLLVGASSAMDRSEK
jgi:hypothetical protein